ncbi:carbohydrate ABC transporter permease [Paenibacillus lentus]|uniref:Carbohydrate ABC transporter permease n=1 Tax=Paenibacillus lentus TaxID=1338368 RepID=A0A3Q8SDN4_9BACL|nr:carbohydrate ABC transporter permease [Paenibacillus lentus]AZK48291.1 carbohydrate ABC transporter permease [Paenibacillus lentus]
MRRSKEITLSIVGILIVSALLFPIYWMIISSFKIQGEIFQMPPTLIPNEWYVEGYTSQLIGTLGRSFINSFIVAISSMAIVVVLAIPASYGLARYPVPGKKWMILFFLVTQMLPVTVVLTPLFILFKKMALLNSLVAPILATATLGIPFSVLILRTYFLNAPKELEDAAMIDGCNRFTAFLRIMIPISYPGIIISATFSFLFAWGDLIYSMTFISDSNMWPLTAGVYNSMGKYGIQWNNLLSFATITILPVLAMFIVLQRYIISGLTNGAVK